jgi:hypothetical protein
MLTVTIFGCMWVATIVFLGASAWRNRRVGYHKHRRATSVLMEEWAWLSEINDALKQNATQVVAVPHVMAGPSRDVPIEQIVNLGIALQTNPAAPVEIEPQAQDDVLAVASKRR